jgi:hypothetical protein
MGEAVAPREKPTPCAVGSEETHAANARQQIDKAAHRVMVTAQPKVVYQFTLVSHKGGNRALFCSILGCLRLRTTRCSPLSKTYVVFGP